MEYRMANRMQDMSGSAIREILKLVGKPGIISFAGGLPAADGFPVEQVRQLADSLLTKRGSQLLQYGTTEGYAPLIDACHDFLQDKGVQFKDDEILITAGGQQAIDLLCKAVLNAGDAVLVEKPTFLGALQTFKLHEARLHAVETDEGGVILADLEDKLKTLTPKIVYLIPTFQNPTGITTVLSRRAKIAALCAQYGAILIEDDPYRDLRYRGEALPAIKAMDEQGAVLYCGSFSKVISPGLRVGYAVGNPQLIRAMVIAKQGTDVHTGVLSQALCAAFLAEGFMPPHIEKLRSLYSLKLDAMLKAARNWPKEIAVTQPEGGLFVWATLPQHIDTQLLFEPAIARGVAFVPGGSFHCDGSGKNTMRLNFSNATVEQLQHGMQVLGEVISAAL